MQNIDIGLLHASFKEIQTQVTTLNSIVFIVFELKYCVQHCLIQLIKNLKANCRNIYFRLIKQGEYIFSTESNFYKNKGYVSYAIKRDKTTIILNE